MSGSAPGHPDTRTQQQVRSPGGYLLSSTRKCELVKGLAVLYSMLFGIGLLFESGARRIIPVVSTLSHLSTLDNVSHTIYQLHISIGRTRYVSLFSVIYDNHLYTQRVIFCDRWQTRLEAAHSCRNVALPRKVSAMLIPEHTHSTVQPILPANWRTSTLAHY